MALSDDGLPLAALGLSVRAYNVLRRAGLTTAERVAVQSPAELRGLRNLGLGCYREVRSALLEHGYPDIG